MSFSEDTPVVFPLIASVAKQVARKMNSRVSPCRHWSVCRFKGPVFNIYNSPSHHIDRALSVVDRSRSS